MKTNIFTILANFTPKGTVVTVKTTNGGVVTAKLLENYRPSYDVVLDRPHYPVIITATRIKSVEVFPMSSILDLRTTAANNARRAHKVLFVAMVEAADGTWFELDAISKQHAENLAKDQVRNFNARGASCWEVSPITGKCFKRSFFVKFNNFESGD